MTHPVTQPTGVYALLADGSTVQVRPASAADFEAVKTMHEAMAPGNAYLRFFTLSRAAPEREALRVTREPGPDHAALLALYGAEVAGVASYEVVKGSGARPRRRGRRRREDQGRPAGAAGPVPATAAVTTYPVHLAARCR
ncbi:MAG TPA: hypothetical protein VKG80_11085 [Trebonia sp.]|nr:hypothetical protein [Trebonia sp.]